MKSAATTAERARRARVVKATGAVVGLAAAAIGLGGSAHAADANSVARCVPTSTSAPIIGSWYAQVHFPAFPFPGKTEATMITFTPGGGLVEANPINTSPAANSGFWKQNADCSYSVRLLNFTYDPATTGTQQVLDVDLRFVMDDATHFHSTAANAVVYMYDSKSGQRQGDPLVVPNVTQTTGERFSTWQVPVQFPAEP